MSVDETRNEGGGAAAEGRVGVPDPCADDGATASQISCREALERIYEFMDGELETVSSTEVEAHFRACEKCFPHLHLERAFRERIRIALRRPDVPAELRARVLAILATQGDEGRQGGDRS